MTSALKNKTNPKMSAAERVGLVGWTDEELVKMAEECREGIATGKIALTPAKEAYAEFKARRKARRHAKVSRISFRSS